MRSVVDSPAKIRQFLVDSLKSHYVCLMYRTRYVFEWK